MKKKILMASALLLSGTLFAFQSQLDFEKEIDSQLFINTFVNTELKQAQDLAVLNAGTGFTSRSFEAAKNGATVCALDPEESAIEHAQQIAKRAGFGSHISFVQANFESLPYEANTFDKAFCVHIGKSLHPTVTTLSQNQAQVSGLGAHFRELRRVMKDDGHALIAAPASFDVVFTDGTASNEQALLEIETTLSKIERSDDSTLIHQALSDLKGVMRATFAQKDGLLQLVSDASDLVTGERIWCKTPFGVNLDYYHSEEEYLVAIHNAGLFCEEIKRPCFFGGVKYRMWKESLTEGEKGLGDAYVSNNPFTLYYITKKV